jgi:tetratricopeptide (TPR) repeat protein
MGKKDQRLVAENQFLRAEQLFRARQFKKAGNKYHVAGNSYLKLSEFEKAKVCFINSSKSFIILEKFDTSIELFRQSGEAIPKLKNISDRNSNFVIFSVLSYFCSFVKGSPDEGLDFIKRTKKKVDKIYFKEHSLIKLVSELTIALRDEDPKYLDKIINNVGRYKFRDAELKLLKNVLLLTKFKLLINITFKLDKETYTTKEIINLNLGFDTSNLLQVLKDSFLHYELDEFNITKILVNLSDNLSTSKKSKAPFRIEVGKQAHLEFSFKPHFQVDNPRIGPMFLTCELNNNLIFIYETQSIKPHLISPPATLNTSIKNLRPPLIDQTFPLEILVENKGEGEALDVKIDVEFPEDLKVMRGTTNKQIFSLKTNEELKWEISLKPIEAGDYIIKINLKFMDSDQNKIEETKDFPFSIKL